MKEDRARKEIAKIPPSAEHQEATASQPCQTCLRERDMGTYGLKPGCAPFLDHVSKMLPTKNCHLSEISRVSDILKV